jgi:hypothetical protein
MPLHLSSIIREVKFLSYLPTLHPSRLRDHTKIDINRATIPDMPGRGAAGRGVRGRGRGAATMAQGVIAYFPDEGDAMPGLGANHLVPQAQGIQIGDDEAPMEGAAAAAAGNLVAQANLLANAPPQPLHVLPQPLGPPPQPYQVDNNLQNSGLLERFRKQA